MCAMKDSKAIRTVIFTIAGSSDEPVHQVVRGGLKRCEDDREFLDLSSLRVRPSVSVTYPK